MSMDLDDALQTFIAESRELLQQMEEALLDMESRPNDPETINAIFRAAHTIKGSAGLFGLDHIVAFTHVAESVLDRVRNNEIKLDEALGALLLKAGDYMGQLIELLAAHQTPDASVNAVGQALVSSLETYLGTAIVTDACAEKSGAVSAADIAGVANANWHVSLRFGPDVLRQGMDPVSILRYLATQGEITAIRSITDAVPMLAEIDPEACYLGFELALASPGSRAEIDGAFDFIRDDCLIHLIAPHAPLAEYRQMVGALSKDPDMREILLALGSLNAEEIIRLDAPEDEVGTSQPEAGSETADAPGKESRTAETSLIRVDAAKLDQLIDLVGELIIAGAGASMVARKFKAPELTEATAQVSRLVENVRDSALTLRMVQIGATFNRFRRVVRDVAREIGKDIELDIRGGDTELDKTVVEKIGDPLTHIVRNSMDHGIEAADVRLARGKPAVGQLRLNAFHESGSIVIEVSDDGGGLKKDRILQKAIERGLVSENQSLSDKEIFNLVFEPGFSTAEQVSKLSGRGVGMDVVKRNIQALRGTVDIESIEGVGTTVRIRLPLTLAIIDGFMVGVGAASYVLPLDMVVECIELPPPPVSEQKAPDYLNLRGGVLPFVRLREQFEVAAPAPARENVVVVQYAGQRAGLVVDRLMGEFQTVIKPLGKVFSQIRGIGGSTILGSGEVALILDIPGLIKQTTAINQHVPGAAQEACIATKE
ncbi:chemotaxis protein CheA [Quatrionicoccus australiensis]|uniref:chemotaxis protein CheA n=1 Tax=Quatrionicoccus australiensis TaxID=138118 RepID=UPI001CF88D4F|nr:chemotaxis protein CheA [Quatrionicoccus australiensis]